jgi:hypothetical protein
MPSNQTATKETRVGHLIRFSLNQQCGVSVANALAKEFSGLEGADDHVFQGIVRKSNISLRIQVCGSLILFTFSSLIRWYKVGRIQAMGFVCMF